MSKPQYQGLFNGCVGYWDFNGDAKDCINGNDGTVSGATLTTNRFGMQNRAYSFDGSDDYIDTGLTDTWDSDKSVAVWFKSDTVTNNITLISSNSGVSTDSYWHLRISGVLNALLFRVDADGSLAATINSNTLSINTWYFAVAVFKYNNIMELYINGAQQDYTSITSLGTTTPTRNIEIGRNYDSTGKEYFDGIMSEVIYWNRALSSGEVLALYNLTKYKPIYPYMRRTTQR